MAVESETVQEIPPRDGVQINPLLLAGAVSLLLIALGVFNWFQTMRSAEKAEFVPVAASAPSADTVPQTPAAADSAIRAGSRSGSK